MACHRCQQKQKLAIVEEYDHAEMKSNTTVYYKEGERAREREIERESVCGGWMYVRVWLGVCACVFVSV